MKIRSIPKEYEAIVFNGINDNVREFISNRNCNIYKDGDKFVLSNFFGNEVLYIGDYLFKYETKVPVIGILHNDSLFDGRFEVIE